MYHNRLPSLDITVASEYHRLYNHESVADLAGYARGLQAEHGISDRYSEASGKETLGLYMGFATQGGMEHHVMRKPLGGGDWEFYTQAHEETHALHHMHALDALQERLNARGLDVDLSGYHDPYVTHEQTREMRNEYVAHIGALYAMDLDGRDVQSFIGSMESRKGLPIGMREALWTFGRALSAREGRPMPEPKMQGPVALPGQRFMEPAQPRRQELDSQDILVVVGDNYGVFGYGIIPASSLMKRRAMPALEDFLDEFFLLPEQRRMMELLYGKRQRSQQYGHRAYASPY